MEKQDCCPFHILCHNTSSAKEIEPMNLSLTRKKKKNQRDVDIKFSTNFDKTPKYENLSPESEYLKSEFGNLRPDSGNFCWNMEIFCWKFLVHQSDRVFSSFEEENRDRLAGVDFWNK